MVCNVRFFYCARYYRRMASIATTSVWILCCIPQSGICFEGGDLTATQQVVNGILNSAVTCDVNDVSMQFDKLIKRHGGKQRKCLNLGELFCLRLFLYQNFLYIL